MLKREEEEEEEDHFSSLKVFARQPCSSCNQRRNGRMYAAYMRDVI